MYNILTIFQITVFATLKFVLRKNKANFNNFEEWEEGGGRHFAHAKSNVEEKIFLNEIFLA